MGLFNLTNSNNKWPSGTIKNNGNDEIHAKAGNDIVHGGKGNDKLFGDGGNDHLWGDTGNDTLTGGTNKDTFHYSFAGNNFPTDSVDGDDVIADFKFSQKDTLNLDDIHNFFIGTNQDIVEDWDLTEEITVTSEGNDTVISFGGAGGGSIELTGIGAFESLTDINNAAGYDAILIT